jgi:bacterial/archaeal transporter family-2 protein
MHFWYCLLAILAGTLIPLQAGINAELKRQLASPYYATLISVVISSIAISLVCLLARLPIPQASALSQVPCWTWTGGVVGVVYVFMVLILAPKLGATALVASIIGGQMLCSLLLDQFALIGFTQHALSPGRMVGLMLLFAGVMLINRY